MSCRPVLIAFMSATVTVLGFITVRPLAQTATHQMAMKVPMSDDEYSKTMKQIAPTFQSLQKNNTAMNYGDAAKDAQKLEAWFKDVQAYWEAKKVDDAVGFAKTAVAAAQDTSKAAGAMNATGLTDAQKALGGACQGCHTAHREKLADGGYKMK
jgi:mono/diheme cytochrome c family protein